MLSLTTIYVKAQSGDLRGSMAAISSKRQVAPKHALRRNREEAAAASPTDRLELGPLNRHLGYFLRRVQVAVFKDFIRTLAPMDVRPAQYSVLLLIEANPGRSQAAIGHALHIERARLARMLHVLEQRTWIERRAADGDGRSHSLFLTREGAKALVRIKELAARHEGQTADLVGAKRRLVLMDLLHEFG
jgi:DNA-binding MarR family transcriptional regulator